MADACFTLFFLLELAVNLTAHWFRDFIRDSWNIFDFFIVSITLVSLFTDMSRGNWPQVSPKPSTLNPQP